MKPKISFSKAFFNEILKNPSSVEDKKNLRERLGEKSVNVFGISLRQLFNNIKKFKKREDIIKLSRIIHEVASEDRKRDEYSLINKGSSDNSTPITYREMIYVAIEKSIEGRFNQFIYNVMMRFLHLNLLFDMRSEVERITFFSLLDIKRLEESFRDKNLYDVSRIILDMIYRYFIEGCYEKEQEAKTKESYKSKLQYHLIKYGKLGE